MLTEAENAPQAVTSLLESAAAYLEQSEEAYEAEAFTRAIPLARRSAAVSLQSMGLARGGR